MQGYATIGSQSNIRQSTVQTQFGNPEITDIEELLQANGYTIERYTYLYWEAYPVWATGDYGTQQPFELVMVKDSSGVVTSFQEPSIDDLKKIFAYKQHVQENASGFVHGFKVEGLPNYQTRELESPFSTPPTGGYDENRTRMFIRPPYMLGGGTDELASLDLSSPWFSPPTTYIPLSYSGTLLFAVSEYNAPDMDPETGGYTDYPTFGQTVDYSLASGWTSTVVVETETANLPFPSEGTFEIRYYALKYFEGEGDELWLAYVPFSGKKIKQLHGPLDSKPFRVRFDFSGMEDGSSIKEGFPPFFGDMSRRFRRREVHTKAGVTGYKADNGIRMEFPLTVPIEDTPFNFNEWKDLKPWQYFCYGLPIESHFLKKTFYTKGDPEGEEDDDPENDIILNSGVYTFDILPNYLQPGQTIEVLSETEVLFTDENGEETRVVLLEEFEGREDNSTSLSYYGMRLAYASRSTSCREENLSGSVSVRADMTGFYDPLSELDDPPALNGTLTVSHREVIFDYGARTVTSSIKETEIDIEDGQGEATVEVTRNPNTKVYVSNLKTESWSGRPLYKSAPVFEISNE